MAKRLASQLFVSRLSSYTTNQELKTLFSPFGLVTQARLVKDPKTQRPKGFGFVSFQSEDEAQKALEAMNGRSTYMLQVVELCIRYRLWILLRAITITEIVRGRLIFVEVAKTESPENGDSSA
ncbi:hypothetical protein Ddye_022073 [Dipteronia dyeriana]|uniref:RRM domain-containing protein n=1 Tax=Dipteronia dyeriana TaxID=168575 RepID=A0AAD9WY42_9ROSI|nr:hypothetical protein Ddye_022073 [Dipteronia dyeriana]